MGYETRDILYDLLGIADQLEELIPDYPQFEKLILFIIKKKEGMPTLIEAERSTGLTASAVRRQIKELYNLVTEKEGILFFRKLQYSFRISHEEQIFPFTLTYLAETPKVGEEVVIPLLRSRVEMDSFMAKSVTHLFEGKVHEVRIILEKRLLRNPVEFL